MEALAPLWPRRGHPWEVNELSPRRHGDLDEVAQRCPSAGDFHTARGTRRPSTLRTWRRSTPRCLPRTVSEWCQKGFSLRQQTIMSLIIYLQNRIFWRADERTRTADLLITSDQSRVAEACPGLHIPHI